MRVRRAPTVRAESLKRKRRIATSIRTVLRGGLQASVPNGFGQARKGEWWMPWRREAMKDVASCDMPRGAAKRALIRGFPNGETHPGSCLDIPR